MFPGTAYKVYFIPFFTMPVAPIITGVIIHFMFYICPLSYNKLILCQNGAVRG